MKFIAVLLGLALLAVPAAAEVLKPWAGGATPALELADLQGTKHTLAAYRGKVVLVNFWATWCEPCREEMPSIERLRASLEGRPFVVLAVNLAEPESRIRKFLEAVPVGFPVLLDRDTQTAGVAGEAAARDLHRRPGRPHPLSARRRARLVQAGGAGGDSGLDQVKSILVLALALAARWCRQTNGNGGRRSSPRRRKSSSACCSWRARGPTTW